MEHLLYETIHSAETDFPYLDCNNENINYVSHFHEEIEIILVADGSVDITTETETLTAKENDICIFMPKEIHGFSSMEKNRLYILKLHCTNSQENIDFSQFRFSSCLIPQSSDLHKFIYKKIKTLEYELNKKKNGYGFLANSISNEIAVNIIRSDALKEINRHNTKRHSFYISLLENVNYYLESHHHKQVYLCDIAKFCNLSEYYFAHIFKEVTKTTFYNYLTAFRMNKSVKLLNTDKKIIDVAFECGFSNLRTFNRTFKKFFGYTPSEYKKQKGHH